MSISNLGGHSGCEILLCEENDKIFVRKISSSVNYNKRLKIQAEKQANFTSLTIKKPAVLDMGYIGDLFYFDMEYIQGITLAKYMKDIEVGKVRNLVEMILSGISLTDLYNAKCDKIVFANKIESLKKQLHSLNNQVINKAIMYLERHSWENFSFSACHSDLTLENIMVKDNQLYFIDFLDSFYDCWLLDIGTILQDVLVMWSYRNEGETDINTIIRLIIFRDILIDKIREIQPEYVADVYFALLLKLIRIYPYTNDKSTYDFLNEKVSSILEIIEEGVVTV